MLPISARGNGIKIEPVYMAVEIQSECAEYSKLSIPSPAKLIKNSVYLGSSSETVFSFFLLLISPRAIAVIL